MIILLIVLVFTFYFILKPYSDEDNQIQKNYQLYLNLFKFGCNAFTFQKNENNTYTNVYIDNNKMKISNQNFPVKLDGTPYETKIKWGNIEYNDNGFTVSGTDKFFFTCPNNYIWDNNSKTCQLKSQCKGNKHTIQPYYNIDHTIHEKLYVYCNKDEQMELYSCPYNTIYNGKENNLPGTDICEFYDICQHEKQYTKHTYQINNYPLKENEYYMCENKKSTLITCKPNEYFDKDLFICVDKKPTDDDKPISTTTVYIPVNDNMFIIKRGDKQEQVFCPIGWFSENNVLQCKNEDCRTEFTGFYENEYVRIPTKVKICVNNKVQYKSLKADEVTYEQKSPYQEVYKKECIHFSFKYLKHMITLTGTFEEVQLGKVFKMDNLLIKFFVNDDILPPLYYNLTDNHLLPTVESFDTENIDNATTIFINHLNEIRFIPLQDNDTFMSNMTATSMGPILLKMMKTNALFTTGNHENVDNTKTHVTRAKIKHNYLGFLSTTALLEIDPKIIRSVYFNNYDGINYGFIASIPAAIVASFVDIKKRFINLGKLIYYERFEHNYRIYISYDEELMFSFIFLTTKDRNIDMNIMNKDEIRIDKTENNFPSGTHFIHVTNVNIKQKKILNKFIYEFESYFDISRTEWQQNTAEFDFYYLKEPDKKISDKPFSKMETLFDYINQFNKQFIRPVTDLEIIT